MLVIKHKFTNFQFSSVFLFYIFYVAVFVCCAVDCVTLLDIRSVTRARVRYNRYVMFVHTIGSRVRFQRIPHGGAFIIRCSLLCRRAC